MGTQARLTQAAAFDDDAVAAPLLAEPRILGAEQLALAKERTTLAGRVAARVSHERLVAELEADVPCWTHMPEYGLQRTSLSAKRTVLAALDVTVRLYPASTTPRYDVTTLKPPDRSHRRPNPTGLRNY